MRIRARRIETEDLVIHDSNYHAKVPARADLRRWLIAFSKSRFDPVGAEGAIVGYTAYDSFRPTKWADAIRICAKYGYEGTPATAWPKLVHDLTGLRVANQGETNKATRYWSAQLDEPLDETNQRAYEELPSGLPVSLEWRDVYEWDCRRKTYAPVAKMSVWSVR